MTRAARAGALYALFLAAATGGLLELSLRAYFATRVGPRVLLYGTDFYRNQAEAARRVQLRGEFRRRRAENHSVFTHTNRVAGYSKFFPRESKVTHDVDTGEVFPVRINDRGFRGPDVPERKDPDVRRVVTLGSSSTFGYYNRDETTYPRQLEAALNARCSGSPRYQVLNLAVPHLTSREILALFRAEGLDLAPDVVTFYEGRNDSAAADSPDAAQPARWAGAGAALGERSLLVRFALHLAAAEGRGGAIDPQLADRLSAEFLSSVSEISEECRRRGIRFIAANQQASSLSGFGRPAADRARMRGLRYAEEVEIVQARLARGEAVDRNGRNLILHQRLMRDLADWARRRGIPFVDVIGLLDLDRHLLLSWVHLHPEANRRIAEAFADEILRDGCAGGPGRAHESKRPKGARSEP